MHFDDDRSNTPIAATLILKMGGQQAPANGIHWHRRKVYYIAEDAQRQTLPGGNRAGGRHAQSISARPPGG
jgi:hypothetical protein